MIHSNYSKPLVSVLVVTYNQKEYIRQALDSILMQVCDFDFEVLIGEDCSTDGTRDICIEYAEKYANKIRLFLNPTNKGLLNNYFDLLESAKGNYLADCGADDYWLDVNRLQQQVSFLEQHPESGMIAGNWTILEEKTGTLKTATETPQEGWLNHSQSGIEAIVAYLNTKNKYTILLTASCCRMDWVKAAYQDFPYLFRGEDATCEDLPILLSMLHKGPIYLSTKQWAVYRHLENSVSHSTSTDTWMKGFAFKTFVQTLNIAATFGVPFPSIGGYIKSRSEEFALYSFLNSDSIFMADLKVVLRKNHCPISGKIYLLSKSMNSKRVHHLLKWMYLIIRPNQRTSKK